MKRRPSAQELADVYTPAVEDLAFDLLRVGTRLACQGGLKGVDAGLPPAPG